MGEMIFRCPHLRDRPFFGGGPWIIAAAWVSYASGLVLLAASLLRRRPVVLAPALLAAAASVLTGNAAGQLLVIPAAILTLASLGVLPAVAVALAALELALLSPTAPAAGSGVRPWQRRP